MEIRNEKNVSARIHVRIPGWAMNHPVPSDLFTFSDNQMERPSLQVNGKHVMMKIENGYVIIDQT